MSEDGPSKGAGWILTGLVFALIGTTVCTILSAYPVSFCTALPPGISVEALLIAGICYFAGFAGLIFLKSLTALKYGLITGLTVTLGILAWNGILSLANVLAASSLDITATMVLVGAASLLAYIFLAQKRGSELAPSPALTAGIQHSNSVMNTKDCVKALEVVQYSSDYLSSSDQSRRAPLQIANHLVETLVRSGVPICVRLQKVSDKLRLIFLTYERKEEEADSNLQTLEKVLESLFPGFGFRSITWPPSFQINQEKTCTVLHMTGEPAAQEPSLRSVDGLTAVAEMLKRTESDTVLQVWVAPHKPGFFERRGARHDFENRIQSSPQSISVMKPGSLGVSPSQESYVALDPIEAAKKEKAARHLTRVNSDIACRVWVSAAAVMKLDKFGHSRTRDTDRLKRLYWGSCFRYRLLHRDWVSVPRPSDGGTSREGSHIVERPVVISAYLPAR